MKQTITEPTAEDLQRIEAQRAWVRGHFTPETEHKYSELDQKLRLLDTILKNRWIKPNETYKLQCLGITFSDALAQKIELHWVMVSDDYGRDPALQYRNSSILVFPLTMISNRIERGGNVDVYQLFHTISSGIVEQIAKGN